MSDLLNSASLVLIPSGYKEDVVYSAVPTDGSGDMSFTRASNGTRVNSAGLVEVVAWNLVEQSETFDNASWSKFSASITANFDVAPNGTNTADRWVSSGGSFPQISQNINLISGSVYTASLYVKSDGTTQIQQSIFIGGSLVNFTPTTTWQRITVTFTAGASASFVIVTFSGSASASSFLIYGAQLNIGSTAKPYFPTTDRLNVPRLTYQNGGGGCPSLLLEKQSTNLVVQSNDMTTWTNGGGTMTKNATTSPDGTNNALSFDNSGDCSTFASASNGVHAWSVFVKQGTSATASIDMSDGATGDVITTFTFSTKTFSGTSAGGSWTSPSTSYIDLGNGWYRITLIATKNAGSSIGHKIIASGSGYTYVYGAQLEASSYPTSYIPTTSASATRVADACFKTGISSLIGQTEGVMFVDFVVNGQTNSANILNCEKNTTCSLFMAVSTSVGFDAGLYVSGSLVGRITGGTINIGERYKVAYAYKSGSFVLYINGVQIGLLSSTFTFPTTLDDIFLNDVVYFNYPEAVKYNQVAVFPTRLTNAELASITTL